MITFDYDEKKRKGKLVCDSEILSFIRNHFSVKDGNAAFANKSLKMKGSSRKVPERQYAILASGNFDLGLYEEIQKFLVSEQITEVEQTETFKELVECGCPFKIKTTGLKYDLRDYQIDCVQECINRGFGTIVSATGSGKSLMQAYLLENWKLTTGSLKCLLIVPGVGLVNQLCKDFEEYGVSFSFSPWTGNHPKQDTDVVIANTEILTSQFFEFADLLNVDLVLRDECHGSKSKNEITKIVQKIKTINKYGFTGTLPKENIDRWKILGLFGPIIFEKSSKELRDENFLTNTEVKVLKLIHRTKNRMKYKDQVDFLEQSPERNELIYKIGSKLKKNTLILVNHLEHGHALYDLLKKSDKQVYFIYGEMPVEDRQKIIDLMEVRDDIVCIAMSAIFAIGINVKNLHYVMFTFGGKSFIRTIQSIGRGIRLHDTKQKLVIFDLYDNMNYSEEHFEERRTFYEDEKHPYTITEIKI